MKTIFSKLFVSLLLLGSTTIFGESLCLNQVGEAAYKAAIKSAEESDSQHISENMRTAVSKVSVTGASSDYRFYEVVISGRRLAGKMIIGPLKLKVRVFVYSDSEDCEIDDTKTGIILSR